MSLADGPPLPTPKTPTVARDPRWDPVKHVIERLYVVENRSLADIEQIMRNEHGFDAVISQYKYRINTVWKLRKNIPSSKKAALLEIHQARKAAGKSTALTYKGRPVDDKKLRRFAKDRVRQNRLPRTDTEAAESSTPCTASRLFATKIILRWNMPYGAMRAAGREKLDHVSPFAAVSTPSDVAALTPAFNNPVTPQDTQLSPLSEAVLKSTALDRAHLFLGGRYDELLKSMNRGEKRVMSTWLYQFWLFSFKTARCWGRGPQFWNRANLQFDKYQEIALISAPETPDICEVGDASSQADQPAPEHQKVLQPTDLCRWSVHATPVLYLIDPPDINQAAFQLGRVGEPDDEREWRDWPTSWHQHTLPAKLRENLESNDFSDLEVNFLPMSVSQVLKSVPRAENDLLREGFSFSIISRNLGLTFDLAAKVRDGEEQVSDLYFYHLATSYIDGAKTCCNLFSDLIAQFDGTENSIDELRTNELGHTILDNLMIAILKSHTECTPGVVEQRWMQEHCFRGEEVDICGRWDADSECIRALRAQGKPTIPTEWKHKFCHTSAQTIVHLMTSLIMGDPEAFTAPSGLFLYSCPSCRLQLQLPPLHTFILTAFNVARYGLKNEDLFGMVACLLCMLSYGANTLAKAQVSVPALLKEQNPDICDHEILDVVELSTILQNRFEWQWSGDVKIGWQMIVCILKRSRDQWAPRSPDDNSLNEAPVLNVQSHNLEDAVNTYGAESSNVNVADAMEVDTEAPDARNLSQNSEFTRKINLQADPQCRHQWGRDDPDDDDYYDFHNNYFGSDQDLGLLWAAVRTEMLTYRRQTDDCPWQSAYFDMRTTLDCLLTNTPIHIGFVEEGLMKEPCRCGFFSGDYRGLVTMEQVSQRYFANLDDWSRITLLRLPARIERDENADEFH